MSAYSWSLTLSCGHSYGLLTGTPDLSKPYMCGACGNLASVVMAIFYGLGTADFPATGAGQGEGNTAVSETETELDAEAGADAQDDNASAEPEAGPATDEGDE